MINCEHNFIDVKDGSLDKICTICGKKAMQGMLRAELKADVRAPITEPMARKDVEVHVYNGTEHSHRMKIYEDELIKSIQKSIRLFGMKFGG